MNFNTVLLLLIVGLLFKADEQAIWSTVFFVATIITGILETISASLELLKRYYQHRIDKASRRNG